MIDFIELIRIFILSVVQGITEWLPISSTGHLILVEDLMPLVSSAEFKEIFFVWVQLGSIFAVILLYFSKLNPFSLEKSSQERQEIWNIWFKVIVATIPAGLFGLALNDYMEKYLNRPLVVALMLIIYGVGFIWVERSHKSRHSYNVDSFDELTYMDAFKIGCFQALSIIPGTSRSGSTIIGGLIVGANRSIATEFSFFMSIPVMFGASFLKVIKIGFNFTFAEFIYLVFGMFISFIVSVLAIRFLLNYIKRNDFTAFGYYRIVLGLIVIVYTIFC